jgi:hypothetical protein
MIPDGKYFNHQSWWRFNLILLVFTYAIYVPPELKMQLIEIISLLGNLPFSLNIFCARNCHLFSVFNSFLITYYPIGPSLQFRPTFSSSKDPAKNIFPPPSHEQQILRDNPFEVLDVKCVGGRMRICPPSPLQRRGEG